jgi:hypothetical protein
MLPKSLIGTSIFLSTTLLNAQEDSSFLLTDSATTPMAQLLTSTSMALPLWVYVVIGLCVISSIINVLLALKLRQNKSTLHQQDVQGVNTIPSVVHHESTIPSFKNLTELLAWNQNIPLSHTIRHLQSLCHSTTDFTYIHPEIWKTLDAVLGFQTPFFQTYQHHHQLYWKGFTDQFGTTRRLVLQSKELKVSQQMSQHLTHELLLGGLHALEYAYGVTGQFHIVPALSSQNNIKLVQLNTTIKDLPLSSYEVFSNSIQKSSAGEALVEQWLQHVGLKSRDRVLIQNRYYPEQH